MSRVDDGTLGDDTVLWRRVKPNWLTTDDEGNYRPQSIAFVDRRSSEVSVFVAKQTTLERLLEGFPEDSVVSFLAAIPRSVGGIIAVTPENPDPAHRVICYQGGSPMKRAAKKLTENNVYTWVKLVIPPPQ